MMSSQTLNADGQPPSKLQLRPIRSPFRSDILSNEVVLITGGGSGIGFEITRQLGLHGAKVVIMGRRLEVLEKACHTLQKEGIKAEFVQGDVRNHEHAKNAVETAVVKFGHLSMLVNSAAGNFLVPGEDLNPKGFRTVLEIDTLGVFTMCHAAFPELKKWNDSNIINISAMLQQPATWYQAHASAAKAAIDSLTRSLALEWGEYGIRVNGIAPGPIAGTTGFDKLSGSADVKELSLTIPTRRFGSTLDIGLACVYLASDAGTFINGDVLVIDGGNWLWKQPLAPRDMIRAFSRSKEKEAKKAPVGIASKL